MSLKHLICFLSFILASTISLSSTSSSNSIIERQKKAEALVDQLLEDGYSFEEINQSLNDYLERNPSSPLLNNEAPLIPFWKSLCQQLEKKQQGFFYVDGQVYQRVEVVGETESSCYGRCGPGCSGSSVYTQECLNHDICRRVTGENLGVCSGEFWTAAVGYLFAPKCYI